MDFVHPISTFRRRLYTGGSLSGSKVHSEDRIVEEDQLSIVTKVEKTVHIYSTATS